MTRLTVERTLVFRSQDGSLTRYEILRSEEGSGNTIDSILVYREGLVSGQKLWVRTEDHIPLNHLGTKPGGMQISYGYGSRRPRDVSSAIDECREHWSEHYE